MASKFFRKAFEFIGKKGPTIKGVQPTKSKAVQDKIKLIKKAGKLQKKQGMDTYKKIGVDKVTKDIYKMDVPKSLREKKAEGGVLKKLKKNDPDKKLRKEGKLPPLKMFKKKQDKKKNRLEELRKELGMKKGGKAKFPDLTGDGKVTRADILKGRGVFRKGGASK
jgi:hypothetical protein